MAFRARVITVSDRSASGEREDRSGPLAVGLLRAAGWDCPDADVTADGADSVEAALRQALSQGADLVVTTGGTGIAPRDRTPDGALRVLDVEIPGIAEELRRRGLADTPRSVLSRGVVGIAGRTLVVTLPGSTAAVTSGISYVLELAPHVIDQLHGGDH